jgi:hypothetical protein
MYSSKGNGIAGNYTKSATNCEKICKFRYTAFAALEENNGFSSSTVMRPQKIAFPGFCATMNVLVRLLFAVLRL